MNFRDIGLEYLQRREREISDETWTALYEEWSNPDISGATVFPVNYTEPDPPDPGKSISIEAMGALMDAVTTFIAARIASNYRRTGKGAKGVIVHIVVETQDHPLGAEQQGGINVRHN